MKEVTGVEVVCSESVTIRKGEGKKTYISTLDVKAKRDNESRSICLISFSCFYPSFVSFPIESWANVKNTVDRLILKLEQLEKEV